MRASWILAAGLVGCIGGGTGSGGTSHGEAMPSAPALEWEASEEGEQGLRIRLSEGAKPFEPGGDGASASQDAVEVLDADRTAALIARLPPLETQAGDRTSFAKREESTPPPKTGVTVAVEFPPPEAPDVVEVATGPARVLRFAPEGEVPLAPHLSVTFSAPMVAVTTQDNASRRVPVALEPEPPGSWRWVGTRTLLFDPDPRFPMATEYTVTVDAGARTANGDPLEAGADFQFATPPLRLVQSWPSHGPHDLEPLLFLSFDQAVDPAALLPHLALRGGDGEIPLGLARPGDVAEHEVVSKLVEAAEPGRSVVLSPARPLVPGTSYSVVVEEGAPSAEGPRLTTQAQSGSFFTYYPLAVEDQGCAWGMDGCLPAGNLWLRMNNPLDEDAFDPTAVTIEPAVEDFRVRAAGSGISLFGKTQAKTSYTVTLPSSLRDSYGQELAAPLTRSFQVGRAHTELRGPGREFLTLDPAAPPTFNVYSVNHERLRVRIYRVGPESLASTSEWMREARYDNFFTGAPAKERLFDKVVPVEGYVAEELVETAIDLSPYLTDGHGQLFVWVEPVPQARERWQRVDVMAWVQVTNLGLAAFVDQDDLVAWTTALADGRPVAGVDLSLLGAAEPRLATSGDDGLARLAKYAGDESGPHALVATRGTDVAILPESDGWWNQHGGWRTYAPSDGLVWYVIDDRAMYRPGETVRVKGWVRRHEGGPGGGLAPLQGPTGLTWTLYDAQGVKLSEGEAEVDDGHGFDLSLELPTTPNLGAAYVDLAPSGSEVGGWHRHSFQIQEFRRPEFEVTASVDPGPYVLGEHAWVEARAGYFAGGALPDAPVSWEVSWSPASYTPPNRADFRFGRWVPWWHWRGGSDHGALSGRDGLAGKTDALGTHTLQMDFLALSPPIPMSVAAEATIVDVNRQRWTARQSVLLHPSALYVGLQADKAYYGADDDIEISAIVVDLDGTAVPGTAIALALSRLEWGRVGGQWQQIAEEPELCELTSAAEAESCAFSPAGGGTYRITARVKDDEGRPSESSFELYVAGGPDKQPPKRQVEQERLTLVPDQEQYAPGDTAEILVQSPFWPAEGLLRVARDGLMETRRFAMEGATTTLTVPITEAHIPNLWVQVDVIGAAERRDDEGDALPDKARRVAFAAGELSLKVPPASRTLAVTVEPRAAELAPGGSTVVDVQVRDSDGQPVEADVALIAVDEAVLALSAYQLRDPLAVFYADRGSGVSSRHHRASVILANPLAALGADELDATLEGSFGGEDDMNGRFEVGGRGDATGAAAVMDMAISVEQAMDEDMALPRAAPAKEAAPAREMAKSEAKRSSNSRGPAAAEAPTTTTTVAVREDFAALALFAPRVRTDAEGRASVDLEVPDSLTRYRVMAVAVAGDTHFGSAESSVTARKPVMLRPSPPRFLNFGDRAELSLVVQNQTDRALPVELALRASNALVLPSTSSPRDPDVLTAGRRVTVPARDRREVRIPVATDLAGTARFQALVVAGDATDAATFSLPVWTPATSEAFATYGELDEGAIAQPVEGPVDVWPGYGGLEITTSSTAVQALTDALLYLTQYPYDCSEQIASRVMAVAALRDVLEAFDAEQLPPADELSASVDADLERLMRRQQSNGGWGFYGTTPPEPYLTAHVADAVVRAQAAGYRVPGSVIPRMQGYLRNIERHIPSWYSDRARWLIIAHALNVRHQLEDTDLTRARRLLKEAGVQKLPIEASAWLLPVLHSGGDEGAVADILRHLDNRITETAAGAQIDVGYSDDNDYVLLHSSRRTDGIVLDALIGVVPDHDVIPKLVRGLLGHQVRGRWSTTQENSYILLALRRYFGVYEATTPDFVARAWLGDAYVGEYAFRGRTTESALMEVPMGELVDPPGTRKLVLAKDGPGRMYYRIGLRYAPRDLNLEAADHGFELTRAYESIDDPDDVRKDQDGVWHIAAGARVRVRVTMVSPARRTHVMLTDPLPAGLEPMNAALAVTGSLPEDPSAAGNGWWWQGTWYQHQNLRDERAEAFTTLLWSGVWEYSYVATATTPGVFVVPPAKAEEMYHPETFGRTATDRVIVE